LVRTAPFSTNFSPGFSDSFSGIEDSPVGMLAFGSADLSAS
jgi:hypothetical protein